MSITVTREKDVNESFLTLVENAIMAILTDRVPLQNYLNEQLIGQDCRAEVEQDAKGFIISLKKL